MNKQKLQQQISYLEAKLAELKAKVNKPTPAINYWQPDHNEKYYYVNPLGTIEVSSVLSSTPRYRVFKTQEEAKAYAEYIKAEETLKAEIARLNEGWWPDWGNQSEQKYEVRLYAKEFDIFYFYKTKTLPNFMYLKSEELAERLIETHSAQLKTYLSY